MGLEYAPTDARRASKVVSGLDRLSAHDVYGYTPECPLVQLASGLTSVPTWATMAAGWWQAAVGQATSSHMLLMESDVA